MSDDAKLAKPFSCEAYYPGLTPEVQTCNLKDFKGKITVLAFYPADFTPVCTKEMCDFSDNLSTFEDLNAQVIGISTDNIDTHKKFAAQYNIKFPLVADTEGQVGKLYDVSGPLFLKTHRRAIFVIGKEGEILFEKTEAVSLFRTEASEIAKIIENHQ